MGSHTVVYFHEEEMALNETDRGWIKNAISEALRDHAKGWKEAIRIYSLPSVAVAIMIFAFTQWDRYAEFRTHTNDRLDDITGRVKELEKIPERVQAIRNDLDHLLDRSARITLQTAAAGPPAKDIAFQIKDAAEWAVQRKLDIAPTTIQRASEPLSNNPGPEAWTAMTALLNLRSFVNATPEYAEQHVIGIVRPVSPDTLFPARKPGEWLEFIDAQIKLDGKLGESGMLHGSDGQPLRVIDNLIIKNSIIEYRGGKITLINIFFENCKFIITNNDNGRRMAEAILNPRLETSFTAD